MLRVVRRISEIGPIAFVHQKEQLGLGHAVLMAKELVGDEPFAVLLSDDVMLNPGGKPVTEQLIEQYYAHRGSMIAVQRVPPDDVDRYGIVVPAPSGGAAGRDRRPGREAAGRRRPVRPGRAGSLHPEPEDLRQARDDAARRGRRDPADRRHPRTHPTEQPVFGYQFEGVRHDAGTRLGWLKANIAMSLESDLADELRTYVRSLDLRD